MPPRTRKPTVDPEPLRRNGGAKSFLAGLLSLSWVPSREPARPGGAGGRSMPVILFSLSTVWLPWIRKHRQRGDLKREIMAALAHVDYYEDRNTQRPTDPDDPGARPVGLSYREIQRRLRVRHPRGKVSIMTIRSYARDAKQEGHVMPHRRPYSKRHAMDSGPS